MDEIIDFPDQPAPVKRPPALMLVCVINWVVTLLVFTSAGFLFQHLIMSVDFIISLLYMLVCVIACIGIWKMKHWAAITYIVSCITMLVVMLISKTWLWPMIMPIVSVLVIERYFRTFKVLLPNR